MTYKEDSDALEQGKGELWEVRVINSADGTDYVDLHVRALTDEDAAAKAEQHARRYPDMYFEQSPPTFDADRNNVFRVGDDSEENDS
jgi:hypothetical protein